MKLLDSIVYRFSQRYYWEGIETGIALGEYFERDRVADIILDQFIDLPATTYTVTKPEELGKFLVSKIREVEPRD